eukprot:11196358-Lingulodinium_polyedra.AAC.1
MERARTCVQRSFARTNCVLKHAPRARARPRCCFNTPLSEKTLSVTGSPAKQTQNRSGMLKNRSFSGRTRWL